MVICPHCSTSNIDEMNFCTNCGTNLLSGKIYKDSEIIKANLQKDYLSKSNNIDIDSLTSTLKGPMLIAIYEILFGLLFFVAGVLFFYSSYESFTNTTSNQRGVIIIASLLVFIIAG